MAELLRDDNVLTKWIHLATNVALAENAYLANPTIRPFLASLFHDAGQLLRSDTDTDSVDDLRRSCPQESDLATSLAFRRMTRLFGPIKRHYGVIVFGGGAVLIAMGVLMWTGEWTILNQQAQNGLSALGINFVGI